MAEEQIICPKCGSNVYGSYRVRCYANYMYFDPEQDRIKFSDMDHPIDADIDETDLYDIRCSKCDWSLLNTLKLKYGYDREMLALVTKMDVRELPRKEYY